MNLLIATVHKIVDSKIAFNCQSNELKTPNMGKIKAKIHQTAKSVAGYKVVSRDFWQGKRKRFNLPCNILKS